jgi:hypothetical protein
MQRLRQNNSGAALPLDDDEILAASTTQTLRSGWCHVRMRLAANQEAERSVHLYDGPDHTAYHHEWIVLSHAAFDAIVAAVQAAVRERPLTDDDDDEDDSQALYRTIVFRDAGGHPTTLAVEYQFEKPIGPAAAFESAWRLLASQFPARRDGNRGFAGLAW